MIMTEKPTYTLWHGGDLIATGPHTRETLDEFIARGMQNVHDCVANGLDWGTAEVYSSHDDGRVWSFEPRDLKEMTPEDMAEMDSIYEEFEG